MFARLARVWDGAGATASWRAGGRREGYEAGTRFLRLLITAIYFLKTAGLGALAGLAMIAIGVALVSSRETAAENAPANS